MKNVCDGSHENCPTCNAVAAVNKAERTQAHCRSRASDEYGSRDCPDFDDCVKARYIAESYELLKERNKKLETLLARILKGRDPELYGLVEWLFQREVWGNDADTASPKS